MIENALNIIIDPKTPLLNVMISIKLNNLK